MEKPTRNSVKIDDPIHPRHGHDNFMVQRYGRVHETRVAPLRHHGDPVRIAVAQDLGHLFRGGGTEHDLGLT